jgi:hypothetical protein
VSFSLLGALSLELDIGKRDQWQGKVFVFRLLATMVGMSDVGDVEVVGSSPACPQVCLS